MILFVILFSTACSQTSDEEAESSNDHSDSVEQIINVGQGVDATSLDPPMSTNIADKNITSHIFDTLIYRNDNMELEENLATSWKAIDDNTWEIELREGIEFHNGEKFDANDVKYSIERIIDPEFEAPSRAQFMSIEKVEIESDYKVKVITSEPYPVLPAVLSELWIVPNEYTEENGKEELANNPVGTGPFKFVEWIRDEKVVLEANNDYWKGKPKLDEIHFLPIPESGTRIAMLQTGELDIVANLPPYNVEDLEENDDIDVLSVLGARTYFVGLDTIDDSTPIADPKVRHALAHAIDVETIIEETFSGYGTNLATILGEDSFGFNPSINPVEYDPDKAKELLKEAGYPNGFSIEFDSPNGRYPMDSEVSQVISGQLADIGIDINLNIKEWGTFVGAFTSDTEEVAPMWLMGWSIPTFDADAILYPLWTPDTYSRYDNDEMTKLLTDARYNMDSEKRLEQYHAALELAREDMIQIPLYQLEDIYGKRSNVHWQPRADERILLFEAYKE